MVDYQIKKRGTRFLARLPILRGLYGRLTIGAYLREPGRVRELTRLLIEAGERVRAIECRLDGLEARAAQHWEEYVQYSGVRFPQLIQQVEERIWREQVNISSRLQELEDRISAAASRSEFEARRAFVDSAIGALEHQIASYSSALELLKANTSLGPSAVTNTPLNGAQSTVHDAEFISFETEPKESPSVSLRLGSQALEEWELLRPSAVKDGPTLIRVGRTGDGGYVMLDDFESVHRVISCGAGDDISWDIDLANRHKTVYLFDHTIEVLPDNHDNVHWKPFGVGPERLDQERILTIDDIIEREALETAGAMILKLDIEGNEWELLAQISKATLDRFAQIVVEFHGLTNFKHEKYHAKRLRALKSLRSTHTPVHIHANNFGRYQIVGGVPLPDVVEVTWVKNDAYEFSLGPTEFPIEGLDYPCDADRADYNFSFKRI